MPGRVLLDDAELEVERGEHVVLVGANGSGKTTLIETLAGRREPASGSVRNGHNVKLGYLSQHADTAAGEGTVLDAAQRETGLTGPKARALLGGFLFSGDDAEKQLSDISGGEQRRLSLAILVASGANVLDPRRAHQPPRHREPRGARGRADGVRGRGRPDLPRSRPAGGGRQPHDRLRGRQAEQPPQRLGRVPAPPRRARAGGDAAAAKPRLERRRQGRQVQRHQAGRRRRRRRRRKLEQRIERAEAELREVEEELADPAAWASPGRAERGRASATPRPSATSSELYAKWEEAAGRQPRPTLRQQRASGRPAVGARSTDHARPWPGPG